MSHPTTADQWQFVQLAKFGDLILIDFAVSPKTNQNRAKNCRIIVDQQIAPTQLLHLFLPHLCLVPINCPTTALHYFTPPPYFALFFCAIFFMLKCLILPCPNKFHPLLYSTLQLVVAPLPEQMNTSEENDESPQLSSCRSAVVGYTRLYSTHEGWAGWVRMRTHARQTFLECPKASLALAFLCFFLTLCMCL